MQAQRIKSIKSIGLKKTLDFQVKHKDHNFYAEGILVSNSHSIAYASVSAMTCLLKFRHPQHFYLALLKMSKNEPNPIEEVSKIQRELYQFNIKLLPPHLIKSEMDFSIEGNDIRFGLSSIKGISEKTIEKLNDFKKSYANKFEIFQAAKEAKLGIGVLSSILQSGGLEDNLTSSRSRTVLEACLFNILTDREKPIAMQLGPKYNFDLFKVLIAMNKELKNDKGKPYIKDSRFETIKRDYAPYKAIYEQNKKCEDFANWWYEKTLLGYSYHTTLQQIFSAENRWLLNINQVLHTPVKKDVLFIGQVSEAKTGTSKKGSPYLKLKIDDETDSITTMIFNKSLDECKSLNGTLPKEGDIVIVKGTKFEDAVFANLISTQTHKIYIKLADLKDDNKAATA